MKADLFLTNGKIVTDYAIFSGGVSVKDGKIQRVIEGDEKVPADQTIDLKGKHLMPGLVDSHVHFNEPGHEEWEGATAGSFSAAAGGITTSLEMPFNALPVTKNAALLHAKREAVKDKLVIDYGQWGLLEDENFDELEEMHEQGVVGFKAFMCDPEAFGWVDSFILHQAMERVTPWNNLVGVHAEDDSLTNGFTDKLRKAGRKDPRAWAESRPPVAELEAIKRSILVAADTGARLHIVHVTIDQGFEAIQQARARGVKVTGETCPHYLALDEDDLVSLGAVAKCGPPLRQRKIVESVWKNVLDGQVDLISSDHCPCTPDMKEIGKEDIWEAWGGITGNQTMLSILLTEGVHLRGLPLISLVRMTSTNPARIFGLYPAKGNLAPGADADLVIVDLGREWTLSADMLFSKHRLSPFIGNEFKGAIEKTFVRGKLVYSNGSIVCEPGHGKIVRRNLSARTETQSIV